MLLFAYSVDGSEVRVIDLAGGEDLPGKRELGLFFGMVWLGKCDELWVFGSNISSGMSKEISKAKERGIPIRYFTKYCEEVCDT